MKFFKPEDFHELSRLHGGIYQTMGEFEAIAQCANDKIEKECKKIEIDHNNIDSNIHRIFVSTPGLINVVFKKECKHPAEKVESYYAKPCDKTSKYFKCECGVVVRAQKFYEVEE